MKPAHYLARLPSSCLSDATWLRAPRSMCIFCQHHSPTPTTLQRRTFTRTSIQTYPRRSPSSRLGKQHPSARESISADATAVRQPQSYQESTIVDDLDDSGEYSLTDDAQAQNDAKQYAEQIRREQKAARQAQVDDAPMHHGYIPATTWDGMETVGGEKEWDTGRKFKSFLGTTKVESPEEITVAIYRAVAEVFASLAVGKAPRTSQNYEVGRLVNKSLQVKIEHTQAGEAEGAGNVRLSYPNAAVEQAVLKAGSPTTATTASLVAEDGLSMDANAVSESIDSNIGTLNANGAADAGSRPESSQSLTSLVRSLGHSWQHVSLQDPKVKFAVAKRITRLTGIPIPDYVIHKAQTVSWLIQVLTKRRQSQKLFDELSFDNKLTQLPNVSLHDRRVTPIDKEIQLGRWKVIEAELQRRDLPVSGRS